MIPQLQPKDSLGPQQPIWARLTDVALPYYAWTEQLLTKAGWIDKPGGAYGTTTSNPAVDANNLELDVTTQPIVLIQRGYFNPTVDWVWIVLQVSSGIGGGGDGSYRLGLTLTPITAAVGSLLGKGTVVYLTELVDGLGNRNLTITGDTETVYNECDEIDEGWYVDVFTNPPVGTKYARARCVSTLDVGGPPDASVVTDCCPDGLPKTIKLCMALPASLSDCIGYSQVGLTGSWVPNDDPNLAHYYFHYEDDALWIDLYLYCQESVWVLYGGVSVKCDVYACLIGTFCVAPESGGSLGWNTWVQYYPGGPAPLTQVSLDCDPFELVMEHVVSPASFPTWTFTGDGACDPGTVCSTTVDFSDDDFYIDDTTLIIAGNNFSSTPANNTVTLNLGAVGTVTAATLTQLTVTLTTQPTTTGALTAVVDVAPDCDSGAAVQVANVVCTFVTANQANMDVNSATLVIDGFGFSTTPANNTVAFNLGASGTVTASTATQITVTFSVQPTSTGALTAAVTNTDTGCGSSATVVATVVQDPITCEDANTWTDGAVIQVTSGLPDHWDRWPTVAGDNEVVQIGVTGGNATVYVYRGECPDPEDLVLVDTTTVSKCVVVADTDTVNGYVYVRTVFTGAGSVTLVGTQNSSCPDGSSCANAILIGVGETISEADIASDKWYTYGVIAADTYCFSRVNTDTATRPIIIWYTGPDCGTLTAQATLQNTLTEEQEVVIGGATNAWVLVSAVVGPTGTHEFVLNSGGC
jgi:hypothetical protein